MSKIISLDIGSLSWIHQQISPIGDIVMSQNTLSPVWIPKTYTGLLATKNRAPHSNLDLQSYQTSGQYRALLYAKLEVRVSDSGMNFTDVNIVKEIRDPGVTPPFDSSISWITKFMKTINWAPSKAISDPNPHPGELGIASKVVSKSLHPNSTYSRKIMPEHVIANGLIIFRAGKKTNDIGVNEVKSPFHVPWVWCEWVVTFAAGRFEIQGTGSVFPTHTFYLNGRQYGQQDEPTDAKFTTSWRNPLTIDTATLRVYPTLVVGAPASGRQAEDRTASHLGPITSAPYTVPGSGVSSRTHI